MKKILFTILILCTGIIASAGQVGLPVEQIAFPAVQGTHLICIWDDAAGQWLGSFRSYDHTGAYLFKIPSWDTWYWIGLWDQAKEQYVFAKWIGHFRTE